MWTTRAEREWLATFCFDYLKVQGTPGQQIQTWLRAKATEFVAQFPARSAESHSSLVKRLCNWYGYHSSENTGAQPSGLSAALRLSVLRRPKKPTAIAPWQAYSRLYFKKNSALHTRVHADFDALKAGDEPTLAKYSHLLSESGRESPASVIWLPFYQAVMKELVQNASEEELEAVSTFIKTRLDKDLASHEKPWDVYPGGSDDSEETKKKNYLASQVNHLPDSLEAAFQDVKDATNFRLFALIGGPSPEGGSLSVMRVQTGRTRNQVAGQDGSFETYLGDLYPVLKQKWIQWLATTYTKDEYHRAGPSAESPNPDPPSLDRSATPETLQPVMDSRGSQLHTAADRPKLPTRLDSRTPPPARRPVPRPIHSESTRAAQTASPDSTQQSAPRSPSPQTPGQQPAPESPLQGMSSDVPPPPVSRARVNLAYVSVPPRSKKQSVTSSSRSSPVGDNISPDLMNDDAPNPARDDVSNPVRNSVSDPVRNDTSDPMIDDSSNHVNDNNSSRNNWVLDKHLPALLLKSRDFLLAVPGDDDWERLLSKYVEFKTLAPPTTKQLSATSRPDQVGWWFRVGRRQFERAPVILSLSEYQAFWISWWKGLQPPWRSTEEWPLLRDSQVVDGWDKILVGGKDGLFVVMMTLSWWISESARGVGGGSELKEAITDVSWVVSNLVSVLSSGDYQPPPSTKKSHARRSHPGVKVGPPAKRSHIR